MLRGLAIVAIFVFLNQTFGAGSMGSLLEASWDQPTIWGLALLGIVGSVILVEAFRRGDWQSPRWFLVIFAGIGVYAVFADLWSTLLEPSLDPVVGPFFETLPAWMAPVLGLIFLGVGGLAISQTLKRHWSAEEAPQRD